MANNESSEPSTDASISAADQSPAALARVRALFWDVDGTLFSSEGIIHRVYQRVFERYRAEHGRPQRTPDLEEIVEQIGKPVRVIFQNLVPELPEAERDALSEGVLGELVAAIRNGEGEHYSGVRETLTELRERGFRFFAASNGRRPYVEAILKKNGTYSLFEEIPAVDNAEIRDKNELAAKTLEKHGLRPEEAAVIGDRASDRDAALKNGLLFIAARFGHGAAEEWEGACAFVDSVPELLQVLPKKIDR